MKKRISFYFIVTLAIGLMVGLTNCTKEGPAGPAGANGQDGINGTDGTDGVDGNATCLECHTAAYMDAINSSFAEHKHSVGTSFAYAGTRESCAYCHSNDAFVEFARSGAMIAPGVATSLSCAACHSNHVSLEDGIPAPIREVPVPASLITEGAVYEHGVGNLCATCHQARRGPTAYDNATEDATYARKFTGDDIAVYQAHGAIGPNGTMELVGDTLFVTFDVPTSYVYTSSTHAGPHHGPQANMIAADMGSVQGTPFDRDHHTDCASCHLSNAEVGGGHTFAPDVAMCNDCHGDAYDMEAEQAEIAARLEAVKVALEGIGAIHVAEDGVHPMYASLERAKWNAFWNYMCLYEDKSDGLHNFGYAKQLLTQCETALGL